MGPPSRRHVVAPDNERVTSSRHTQSARLGTRRERRRYRRTKEVPTRVKNRVERSEWVGGWVGQWVREWVRKRNWRQDLAEEIMRRLMESPSATALQSRRGSGSGSCSGPGSWDVRADRQPHQEATPDGSWRRSKWNCKRGATSSRRQIAGDASRNRPQNRSVQSKLPRRVALWQ